MTLTNNAPTILIAEDDPAALSALEFMLTKKYPAIIFYYANDGKIGLEYFMKYLPDIVIADIVMPRMDGLSMALEIKKLKADTKVIILSGLTGMSDLFESRMAELAIDHRLFKPVDFVKLIAAIDQCSAEIDSHG